jgi:hypothetical protein
MPACLSPSPPPHSVEEQTLQDQMQAEHHEADFDMDTASHRLNEIYERMNEVRGVGGRGGAFIFWGQGRRGAGGGGKPR